MSEISAKQLRDALNCPRMTFYRALKQGKIAAPTGATVGGRWRWSVAAATEILRKFGKKPPREWEARAKRAA